MVILGIEAAARACSAAVFENGHILAEERSNAGMTHSETLMPMVDQVLRMAGKNVKDIDAVALTNGPGSFTGLRIGAATAKGIALGLGKPLIPVGTLEALTFTGEMDEAIRVGIMDARRAQVYAAAYQRVGDTFTTIVEPDAMAPAELAEKLKNTGNLETESPAAESPAAQNSAELPIVFFGDAVDLYFDFFRSVLGDRCRKAPAPVVDLSAASVCALAYRKAQEDEAAMIPSDELKIEYLRKSQAERERAARMGSDEALAGDAEPQSIQFEAKER